MPKQKLPLLFHLIMDLPQATPWHWIFFFFSKWNSTLFEFMPLCASKLLICILTEEHCIFKIFSIPKWHSLNLLFFLSVTLELFKEVLKLQNYVDVSENILILLWNYNSCFCFFFFFCSLWDFGVSCNNKKNSAMKN